MKNNGLELCRLQVEFMCYTKMVDSIYYLLKDDSERLINKLKRDLNDLVAIEETLKKGLYECKKQITFVENFLDDCGVNIYEIL